MVVWPLCSCCISFFWSWSLSGQFFCCVGVIEELFAIIFMRASGCSLLHLRSQAELGVWPFSLLWSSVAANPLHEVLTNSTSGVSCDVLGVLERLRAGQSCSPFQWLVACV